MLIVDDDADIREILAEILVEVGFETLTAANGHEALALVRDLGLRPCVILLDLMMPVMDGYDFLEQRTSDPALASIPIVIVTAGHRIDRERIGEGIPIVAKPFEALHLLDVVNALGSRSTNPG